MTAEQFTSSALRFLNQSTRAATYTWNGPICPVCKRTYLGQHTCTVEDLQAQIDGLQRMIDSMRSAPPTSSAAQLQAMALDPTTLASDTAQRRD